MPEPEMCPGKFTSYGREIASSMYPDINNYQALKNKYLELAKATGYGMRLKHPKHKQAIEIIGEVFGDPESLIDLETIGNGELMHMLLSGAAGIGKVRLKPVPKVHATYWNMGVFGDAIKRILNYYSTRADVACFGYSYQELHKIPDNAYDVVMSINVLDHLLSWDDVENAVSNMHRISKRGVICACDTTTKEKIAISVGMRHVQRIGLNRVEWDRFFEKYGADKAYDCFYVWCKDAKRKPAKRPARNRKRSSGKTSNGRGSAGAKAIRGSKRGPRKTAQVSEEPARRPDQAAGDEWGTWIPSESSS